jgi:hypothetical protein
MSKNSTRCNGKTYNDFSPESLPQPKKVTKKEVLQITDEYSIKKGKEIIKKHGKS